MQKSFTAKQKRNSVLMTTALKTVSNQSPVLSNIPVNFRTTAALLSRQIPHNPHLYIKVFLPRNSMQSHWCKWDISYNDIRLQLIQVIWAKLTRSAKAYSISSSVVIVSKIAYHLDHNTIGTIIHIGHRREWRWRRWRLLVNDIDMRSPISQKKNP